MLVEYPFLIDSSYDEHYRSTVSIGSYAVLTLVYYIPPVHENCYESLSFFLKVFCLKIKNSCNIRNAGVFAVCFALDISWKVFTCCIFSYHIYIYIYIYTHNMIFILS